MLPRNKRGMGIRRPFVFLGSGFALIALLAAFWFLTPWGSAVFSGVGESPKLPSMQSPSASLSDAEAVAGVLAALVSDPAAGAAAATRSTVAPEVALPPGSKLSPDQTTWAPDGIGGGTMDVVLSAPGLPDQQFVAVMVKEDDGWRVLGTLDKTEGNTGP